MPVNGIELKVGQKWKTKDGKIGVLEGHDIMAYPFVLRGDDVFFACTEHGKFYCMSDSEKDLDVLLEDVSNPEQTFTLFQIQDAMLNLDMHDDDYYVIATYLTKHSDPEYKEYLRLKEKFKGDQE